MPGCVIRPCPSKRSHDPEAVLHAFPQDTWQIRSWLERTGHRFRDMDAFITRILQANRNDGICSAHFTADCYVTSGEGKMLRAGAVPTIFPPGDKLISEVTQLRVSRKARQARLQNAAQPPNSSSGLAGVGLATPPVMDAETQTEAHRHTNDGERWTRIRGEPGHRGTPSGIVTSEYCHQLAEPNGEPPAVPRSEPDHRSHISAQILQLTLQILYLLTGEDYGPIKKESGDHVTCSPIMMTSSEQKILEVASKIIELLAGKVPARCQDVTMDEPEYEDGHKDAMMEDQPPLRSLDVAARRSEISPGIRRNNTGRVMKGGRGPPLDSTSQPWGERLAQSDVSSGALHTKSTPTSNPKEQPRSSGEHPLPASPRRTRHKMCPSSLVAGHPPHGKLPKPNNSKRTRRSQNPPGPRGEGPGSDISEPHTGPPLSKERSSSGEEHFAHAIISTPSHLSQKRPHVTKETSSFQEEHSGDETDFSTIVVEEEDSMSCEDAETSVGQGHPTSAREPSTSEAERLKFPVSQQMDVPDLPTPEGGVAPLLSEDGLYTDTSAPRFPSDVSALDWPEFRDRSLFCPECGKSFTDKARVEAHLRTHWGEKAYCCSVCPKTFRCRSRFVVHQMTHSGEKPFCCSQCGKRFAQSSYLQRHVMGHTGDKPFPCSLCGKGFSCKSDMVKHELTHTGARPHPCLQCGKRFTKKSHLNRHMRIHTGEKPFCCPDCGRSFGCNSDMVSHQRIHQGIKPFSCSQCGKSFLRKQDAMRHQTVHRT